MSVGFEGLKTTDESEMIQNNRRVILANDVVIGGGDYVVRGMIVDDHNNKVSELFDCVFIGNKENIVKRDIMIADSLVKANKVINSCFQKST